MKNILLADDEPVFLSCLEDLLSSLDSAFKVYTAENGEQALHILKSLPIDLLITDLHMPGMDGQELLLHAAEDFSGLPVIIVSAHTDFGEAKRPGVKSSFCFDKPVNVHELVAAVCSLLH